MGSWLNSAVNASLVFSLVGYGCLLGCVLFCWRPRRLALGVRQSAPKNQVTVVIAARNEETSLSDCLESLLRQTGIAQIIVVDDHSSDGTAVIARGFQNRDPRVVCHTAPPLPCGWVGKSHALHFGAAKAKTPLLVFTDADVIFGEGVIAKAVQTLEKAGLDHLGGHFFVDCQTVAEEICAPVLLASSTLALFGTAQSRGAATGAFNLVRTALYVNSGGHELIRGNLVDDVALARNLKRFGAKSSFLMMGDNLKVRLFVGFRGFVASVTRSAIPFLSWSPWLVCLATSTCMLLAASTAMLAATAAVIAVHSPVRAGWALFPFTAGFLLLLVGRPLHNGRLVFQLLYPVALFLLGASVFCAAVDKMRNRNVSWRGREYSSNRTEELPLLGKEVIGAELWKS